MRIFFLLVLFVADDIDLGNDRFAANQIGQRDAIGVRFEDHFDVIEITGGEQAAHVVIDAGGGVEVAFLDADIGANESVAGCRRANVANFNFADDLPTDLRVAGGQRQRAKNQDKESPSS